MIVAAKHIRTEKFSNRNFYIEIELYEQGLARGRCECKRRGVEKKMLRYNSSLLYFPGYHWMSIVEWNEFYSCFAGDKMARRWVRRVMRHSFDGFLNRDGTIDRAKFAIEDDRRKHRSREYYRMNSEQLCLMRRILPDFFYPGTYRTSNLPYTDEVLEASSKENYKSLPTKVLNHPVAYRKFLQRRMRHLKKYIPVERLKEFLREFDPLFYKQVCHERTMDDCNIELEYRFPSGAIPEMRIFVCDNEYDEYKLPND